MIRIHSNGTKLIVNIDIPKDLNGGKDEHYVTSVELGGSAPSVEAFADRLRDDFRKRIQRIRKDAYEQGAKDRAKRAEWFDDSLSISNHKGGCA